MNLHHAKELINSCTDELYFCQILYKKSTKKTLKKIKQNISAVTAAADICILKLVHLCMSEN